MEPLSLTLPLFAGLLGGLHCLGMCGPIVCAFGNSCGPDKQLEFHGGYQSGRLLAYLFLGAAFGWLGNLLEQSAALFQLQSAAALFGGMAMIALGIGQLIGPGRGLNLGGASVNLFWAKLTHKLKRGRGGQWIALGLMTGLLPCGLLFSIEALAMSTGNWAKGMTVMGLFWLGSLPYLIGAGFLMGRLQGALRRQGQRLLSLILLASGVYLIYQRWGLLKWRGACIQHQLLDPLNGLQWLCDMVPI